MRSTPRPPPIALFTVRLWQEDLGGGQAEWRGEVKNLASGEVRYFREWQVLAHLFPRMLVEPDSCCPESRR